MKNCYLVLYFLNVSGPKAEAGLAPSNMMIGGVKKYPELEFKPSSEGKDSMKTNIDPSTKKRKIDNVPKIMKPEKSTRKSMDMGSNGRLSTAKMDIKHKVTNSESSNNKKIRTSSFKTDDRIPCSDSGSDNDLAGPSKRKRVITIEDSSDASD